MVRLGFASRTPDCDIFILSACMLVSLLFVFLPLFARPLVRPALWLLSRRKGTAVVYQHRGVTSISKQQFYVLTWICHARRSQLSNEACAIQHEVYTEHLTARTCFSVLIVSVAFCTCYQLRHLFHMHIRARGSRAHKLKMSSARILKNLPSSYHVTPGCFQL